MPGTSGNLSARISELSFLITASGKDKGELTEDDFLTVDESGGVRPLKGSDPKPSAETLLHAAIYKHTDANAIFHIHTTNSTLLSNLSILNPQSSILEFKDLEMLKGLGFKTHDVKVTIPVIENSQDMKYLASIVSKHINKEVPGLLLRGHGIYAWGKTFAETKRHVEIFEFLFEYKIKELSLKTIS